MPVTRRLDRFLQALFGMLSRKERWVYRGLVALGVLSLGWGIGGIVHIKTSIQPRLRATFDELNEDFDTVERLIEGLVNRPEWRRAVRTLPVRTASAAHDATEVLTSVVEASQRTRAALESTAHLLREVDDSTGLILPDQAFRQSADRLEALARATAPLDGQVAALREDLRRVAGSLDRVSGVGAHLVGPADPPRLAPLRAVAASLARTQRTVRRADIPLAIARGAILSSGLYLFMGFGFFGMAGIYAQLCRVRRRLEGP